MAYVVWEITLKCNLACSHCGSRAGDARSDELSTAEAIDLIHQMAQVGIKEITLIGGEAYLRPDWLQLAEEITTCGMTATMTTGGYGISAKTAERMFNAGIKQVSVSIDGMEEMHDKQRGRQGSWKQCFKTMEHLLGAGVSFGCNSQINRLSAATLPLLYAKIRDAGARAWQIQLTVPMGNAADHAEMLMQPYELLALYPMLAYLAERGQYEGIQIQPGNNIGYYGPYERLLRGRGSDDPYQFWMGCQAGLAVLGIEADGAIKGCPSLPTAPYTGGNIRTNRLEDIIMQAPELNFNTTFGTPEASEHTWGFCRSCEYVELCRGGCSWTSHVFFNKRGNNPYCHHRSLFQAAQGLRERVFPVSAAPGVPFDNGVFDILQEALDAPWPEDDTLRFSIEQVQWPEGWLEKDPQLVQRLTQAVDDAVVFYRGRNRPKVQFMKGDPNGGRTDLSTPSVEQS
ncbi:MAG: radical SAM protein [Myxococcales bacterium]|nr:radical SAM protein [Myxococcales bacterium]MCB9643480.1 radical SAM protein [Myxococcales bacterium]